jgi:hypothetical protein
VRREALLRLILPGFTLERREDAPLLQIARLALIVATPAGATDREDGSRLGACISPIAEMLSMRLLP